MEQKDNITVYLMSLQVKQNLLVTHKITNPVTWVCLSLNCRLPMPEYSGFHAEHEDNKTKD